MKSNQMTTDVRTPFALRWVASAALAGAVALGASAMVSAVLYGSEAKAEFERRTAAEVAQENQAFCSRLGLAASTPAGVACVRELNEVRRLHDERRVRDDMF